MRYTSVLALVAAGLSGVHAAPYYGNGTNDTYSPPILPVVPTGEYYLVTQVIEPGKEDKDGLYVSGYHTGAGSNDATLGSIDVASIGFFNDTHQQFDYETDFPWGFQMGSDTNYAAWEFVMINGGYGSSNFSFNASGLQWSAGYGFSGWLACDWWHGEPQLFWTYSYYDYTIPSSCAKVNLLAQDV